MAINVLIRYVGEEIDQEPTGYDRKGWIHAGTPSFFLMKIKYEPLPAMMAPPGHGGARASAQIVPDPPRGRPFGGGGVHRISER